LCAGETREAEDAGVERRLPHHVHRRGVGHQSHRVWPYRRPQNQPRPYDAGAVGHWWAPPTIVHLKSLSPKNIYLQTIRITLHGAIITTLGIGFGGHF